MNKLLSLLEKNARLSDAEIAIMLGKSETEVASLRKELETQNIILGYQAVIDWDKTDKELVTANIEIKVTPQKNFGFGSIAKTILNFSEVRSLSLMSGGYDFAVTIEGKTMREVALFVVERLALIDGVTSTATHFVLKKYKEEGILFDNIDGDERGYTGL